MRNGIVVHELVVLPRLQARIPRQTLPLENHKL
jgi:hypothetical protein